MRIGGIVLCGGCSIRMGSPKEMLPFGGEMMLPRVVRIVSEAVQPVAVVAAVGQEIPFLPPSVRVFRDSRPNRGPLEGISSGMRGLHHEVDAVFVTGCDVPLLRSELVLRVTELLGPAVAAVRRIDGLDQPLAGAYTMRAFSHVQRLLAEGRRQPTELVQEVCARRITAEELSDVDPNLESLRKINTMEEYRAALESAGLAVARGA